MPETASRQHWMGTGGPWGTGVLVLGLGVLVQGVGFTFPQIPAVIPGALHELGGPPQLWGAIWLAVGAVVTVMWALTPPQHHWHVLPAVSMMGLWAGAYLGWWLLEAIAHGRWTGDWMQAAGWATFAGVAASLGRCSNPMRTDRVL